MLIAEALTEVKTLLKRIGERENELVGMLYRSSRMVDPHGDSTKRVTELRQSVEDLYKQRQRTLALIRATNEVTSVTIRGKTMSIADWIIWKRETYPRVKDFYTKILQKVNEARQLAQKNGTNMVQTAGTDPMSMEIVVHIDPKTITDAVDDLLETFGEVDSMLSIKNATTHLVQE